MAGVQEDLLSRSIISFWPCLMTCGSDFPTRFKPGCLAVKAPSPKHWTTRGIPNLSLCRTQICHRLSELQEVIKPLV